ncbi:MAG: hypothetical protein K9G57_02850 [Ignavibacteriales bacterium]|nr:hypothetical protein [Ignavibacteriales bacterium]MCF8435756.1 hypothetical protein [Ignavibacteriales bacterium]
MKKLIFVIVVLVTLTSCDDEIINAILGTEITVKDRIDAVLTEARKDFASDAQLSSVVCRNIGSDGVMDLTDFSSVKGFFYIVGSESKRSTEIYIPTVAGGIIKSPLSLSTVTDLVKDANAKGKLESVFGLLTKVKINLSVNFLDSDGVMPRFESNGGSAFRNSNSGTQVDLFLFPSKAIDINSINDSVDWLAHYYNGTNSKIFWYNTATGLVKDF